ncbi:MAG TPA: class I SAM-dependent methyltransferase [Pyrinomonadaceae bacterium]|jgi:SAM-dependent methyltransferase
MSLHDDQRLSDGAKNLFAPVSKFPWNLVSTRLTQFPYFDELLGRPVWKGRKILDFGGNIGTFLESAGDNVDHEDYWCIDLNPPVIAQGRRLYPRAHFIHFNRYSPQYNPHGVRHAPIPECGVKFDFVLAFSVFTHVDEKEMLELVGSLRRMLAADGVLAFTFLDPQFDRSLSNPSMPRGSNVLLNLGPRRNDEVLRRARWFVLLDNQIFIEPADALCHQTRNGKPLESFCSFFTAEYMKSLFPGATVHAPVQREWQHCCVLRK